MQWLVIAVFMLAGSPEAKYLQTAADTKIECETELLRDVRNHKYQELSEGVLIHAFCYQQPKES